MEDYVSHRFLPVAQDHGPNGDDQPINDAKPAAADDEPWVQSEDMQGLIEILRAAAIGDDIVQEFKASDDPTEADPTEAQTQQDSRIADGKRTESRNVRQNDAPPDITAATPKKSKRNNVQQ